MLCVGGAHALAARPAPRRASRQQRLCTRATATVPAAPAQGARAAPPGKPRVVVLGSGWGAISFVKALPAEVADVTLVSPRNYFLYTPLLPGAAVGSVEERSIVEPIRTPLASKGFTFLEAAALRIDPVEQKILCRAADLECETDRGLGATCDLHTFYVSYDILLLAVGSVPNTFGIPGVEEHALFFKEIPDAVRFRREASERFERASLPGITAERARELLTFVFVGAGPTGVELAAELHDMVKQDVARLYPASLLEHVRIEIVDLQDFVLSSYDRRIAEYATAQFRRQNIKLNLGVQVKAVEPNVLVLADKKTGEERRIDFGVCVWCTGIKMNPLCSKLIEDLPKDAQPNIRSLTVDSSLRVKGSAGTIFALGDCATIELKTAAGQAERMLPADAAPLDRVSLAALLRQYSEEYPHLKEAADRVDQEFETHAVDGVLRAPQLAQLLSAMDRGLRTLPATAQVAKQEGEFLATMFTAANGDVAKLCTGELEPFSYKHKGSLAYIGEDAAVADIPGFAILRGVFAGLVWKSFETWSQVSARNQALVFADLLRTKIFGRDLSRV